MCWCFHLFFVQICQIAAENPNIEILTVNFYENVVFCRSLNVNILPFFHFYRGSEGRVDAFSCSLSKVNRSLPSCCHLSLLCVSPLMDLFSIMCVCVVIINVMSFKAWVSSDFYLFHCRLRSWERLWQSIKGINNFWRRMLLPHTLTNKKILWYYQHWRPHDASEVYKHFTFVDRSSISRVCSPLESWLPIKQIFRFLAEQKPLFPGAKEHLLEGFFLGRCPPHCLNKTSLFVLYNHTQILVYIALYIYIHFFCGYPFMHTGMAATWLL